MNTANTAVTTQVTLHLLSDRTLSRFWKKVRKTDTCWIWTAAHTGFGYGCFYVEQGRMAGAHRLSWEIHFGTIPDGQWVLHRCDNPACVRPSHLFLGTNMDNLKDMWTKRRHAHGTSHHQAKLTPSLVRGIRALKDSGMAQTAIGKQFGVYQTVISKIFRGLIWRHV